MRIVPFLGNSIASQSYVISRQRRLNCYVENRLDGDKTTLAVYGTPGLKLQFTLAGTLRGLFGTQTALYAVSGQTFYWTSTTGAVAYSASLQSVSGLVSFAVAPGPQHVAQVLIVDGTAGYMFQYGPGLMIISGPSPTNAFPIGAKTCTYVSSYFVAELPNTQNFWVSAVNDPTTWPLLAFGQASQYEDNILAVDSYQSNLLCFSERHLEFFQATPATPQPFVPILSATSEYGIDAIFSRAHIDNSLIFSAHNPQGTTQICQIRGFEVSVISTPDLDYIIQTFPVTSDAVGLAYVTDGHPMYQITFPSAIPGGNGRSFLYDCLTGIWSETQTGYTNQYAARHRANLATYCSGQTYLADYANGNVYTLSPTQYTDNGAPILRELITRHASDNYNVFTIDEVYLDVETGVGLASGQGSAPQVQLECSKDNARTFGPPLTASSGAIGNYLARLIWRRFGSARDFAFRIRQSDPVKFVVTGGALSVREIPQ